MYSSLIILIFCLAMTTSNAMQDKQEYFRRNLMHAVCAGLKRAISSNPNDSDFAYFSKIDNWAERQMPDSPYKEIMIIFAEDLYKQHGMSDFETFIMQLEDTMLEHLLKDH